MESDIPQPEKNRRFKRRYVPLSFMGLMIVALGVAWVQRNDIADNIVRSELEKREVQGQYEISEIGFRRQVVTNLVIGDPANPDLTAERVEVGLSLISANPGISFITAKGVRLRGRLVDGKLSMGELDKFLASDDDTPFELPSFNLALSDARMRLDTPFGAFGIAAEGDGHLRDGFDGRVAVVGRDVAAGGCALDQPSLYAQLSIADQQPKLTGPLRLAALQCPDMDMRGKDLAAELDIKLGRDLASVDGSANIVSGPLQFAGLKSQKLRSRIDLASSLESGKGDIDLALEGLTTPAGAARSLRFVGPFDFTAGEKPTFALSGTPELRGGRIAADQLQALDSMAATFADSPVGPLVRKLASALRTASGDLSAQLAMNLRLDERGTQIRIADITMRSGSGAKVEMANRLLMRSGADGFLVEGDPVIALSGGGLPSAQLAIDGDSFRSGFAGTLRVAEYRAGEAALTVPVMRFSRLGGGSTGLAGELSLSGPLPDGKITDLRVPVRGTIAGNGAYRLFPDCVTVQMRAVKLTAVSAGNTQLRVCPEGGAMLSGGDGAARFTMISPSPSIAARLGSTPLGLKAARVRYSLSDGLSADQLAVRLGQGNEVTRLDVNRLNARFGDAITGSVSGGSGQIVNVPLLMEDIAGDWRFANGVFTGAPSMVVKDAEQVDRFQPLNTRDVQIRFAGDDITASGVLVEPRSGRDVSNVDIIHRLNSSTGQAILRVDGLMFDEGLQPEELTPLALGVVANVVGMVSGEGRIRWSSDAVESEGTFRTDDMNLAAAFGPVTGLTGEINFVDLMGLVTAPDQLAQVDEVNPGVPVFDGNVRYRLLPDFRIEVSEGRWPFAGGELLLRPTVLDFGETQERRLTFDVVGVDAAEFLTIFDFDNLSATGTFDGTLPMVFDAMGGRIEGGRLTSREGGGTMAYVGELSQEDLSYFANFAFDMLRSLKFRSLEIGMNGDIDGEIITTVNFSGLQQGDDIKRNFITRELSKLPIQFNVRIEAPFMQLLSSVRGYYDPSLLVEQNLGALMRNREGMAKPNIVDEAGIQPAESEVMP